MRKLWAWGLALAWAAPVGAAQMNLTRGELCAVADLVVVGRVSDLETVWAAIAEGGLERRVLVNVGRTVRGAAPKSVEVVLPGGKMGEFWHWVEDVPSLEVDRTYLLLLSRTERGLEVIGGESGATEIATNGSWRGVSIDEALASLGGCDAR